MTYKETPQIKYDRKFDMLAVRWGNTKECSGDDSNPGLIYTRDSNSNAIVGVTLAHFARRYREHRLPVLNDGISLDYGELYQLINQ